jgi:RNA polymerase sigma factor (sigma-70 family)
MALTIEGARQKWSLTQEAFDALMASLGPDRDQAAERYLEIRRNLVRLFEWRGCATPNELADEAINRCAKRIAEGEEIRDVPSYAIGVARMLLRERSHGPGREAPLESVPEPRVTPPEPAGDAEEGADCLRTCLERLSAENRGLILAYYTGDKGEKIRNRKKLGERFGLSPSTLRMRALRLRATLQSCAETCARRRGRNFVTGLGKPPVSERAVDRT